MAITLIVHAPPGAEVGAEEVPPPSLTLDSPRLVLGRGDGCDLRLPDPSVSHRHASLRQRGSEWLIVDEKSTNGTVLGGVKLAPHSPRIVKSGELVRLGRVWIELRIEPTLPTPQAAVAAKELALGLVARALAAEGEDARPRLRVTTGPDRGKELVLADAGRRYVLGRGREVDLVLDDPDASRRHVDVARRGEQLVVQDLGSKAGALLDGVPLGSEDVPWKVGQVLALGSCEIVLSYPAAEALAELERSPDEPLRPGEELPPPRREGAAEPPPGSAPRSEEAALERRDDADELESSRPRPRPRDQGGWGLTDLAVVVLAAGVLALSVAGLFWLLR